MVAGCLIAIWTPAGPDALLIGGGALVVILPFAVVLTGRRFDPFEPVYLFAVRRP